MAGKAWDFGPEYAIATYAKPVVALTTLARSVGEPAMVRFLRTYVDTYAFGHPTEKDVQAVMGGTLGAETAAWFFDELVRSGATLDAQVGRGGDGVALTRAGELCLPVEVKVTAGNETTTQSWSCDGTMAVDDEEWRRVAADPERVAAVDLNLANQVVRRDPDWQSWLGSVARLTRTLQALFRGGWLQ